VKKYLFFLLISYQSFAVSSKPLKAPDNVRISEWAYLCSHNAFSSRNLKAGYWAKYPFYAQQRATIKDQMEKYGVRALMYDFWNFNPKEIIATFEDKVSGLFGKATEFMSKIF